MRRSSKLRGLADEELMTVARDGGLDAFEVLYDRHSGAVFSLAYRIVGDRLLAEDVTQETFLSVWRTTARYDPGRAGVRSWMLSIAHNRAIDAVRRSSVHARRRAPEEQIEETRQARELTDVEAVRREEARTVQSVLRTLPQEQSQVIELAYYGGFTHTEIATMLEIPMGTVKSRMRRGLERMKDELPAQAV